MAKRKSKKAKSRALRDELMKMGVDVDNMKVSIPPDSFPEDRVLYGMLRHYGKSRGYKPQWASVNYKEIRAKWPPREWNRDPLMVPNARVLERIASMQKTYVEKTMKEKAKNYTGPIMKHHPKTITGRLYEPGHDDGTPPWD